MQDTIIKGSGNSRTLGSVPNFLTLYPTYEAFAQALINRELPIDLGPINPAGVDVHGTDLIKSTLLKDTTAALYGKTSAATPDDILAAIRPLITAAQSTADGKCRIQTGTYTGNGTYGASYPNSLTFSFNPVFVMIVSAKYHSTNSVLPGGSSNAIWGELDHIDGFSNGTFVVNMTDLGTGYTAGGLNAYNLSSSAASSLILYKYAKRSSNGRTLTWYNEFRKLPDYTLSTYPPGAAYQFNDSGHVYRYVAIG